MIIRGAVLETIGACRPYSESRPLSVTEIDLDGPRRDEILVRIEAAGVCHSDLSVVNGDRSRPVPMLLGHEAAGIVEQVGEGVTDLTPGQRVVSVFLPRCEECDNCRTGGRLPCSVGSASNSAGHLLGDAQRLWRGNQKVFHHLGVSGFATHTVMNRRSVVPVGEDVPPTVAAVLGCAVLTGGGAVLNAAKPSEGQRIMVVGLGGVGMAALMTARAVMASWSRPGRLVAVDTNSDKLSIARGLGADDAYLTSSLEDERMVADVVIEAAGHPRAFETAVRATAPGGTTVTVGLPAPGNLSSVEPLAITAEARTIIGSYLGSALPASDVPRYEQMWREGQLPVEHLASSTIDLEHINEAMDDLADGKALRQLIVFNG